MNALRAAIVLLCALPGMARAAAAVASTSFNSNSTTFCDVSFTFTAGNAAWYVVEYPSARTLNSVTSTLGNTFTILSTITDSTNGIKVSHAYITNLTGGSDTVSGNFDASASNTWCHVVHISGAQKVLPAGTDIAGQNQASPGTGTDGVSTGNATPTLSPGLLLAVTVPTSTANTSMAAGTGFTSVASGAFALNDSSTFWRTESLAITSATGAKAATFTQGANKRTIAVAIAVRDQYAGTKPMLLLGP